MPQGPLDRYLAFCAAGALTRDPVQERAAARLQALAAALARPWPGRRRGLLGRLLGPGGGELPRGVWLHGGVGRGKSMLMDLLFETAPLAARRRVHFHAFMQEVHAAVAAFNRSGRAGDPLQAAAEAAAGGALLLCFDEFEVTDIADAMILGRLFERFFRRGMVVVATSNHPPRGLYEGGINRQLFEPFIAMLEERLDVVAVDARQDYRLAFLAATEAYHVPADERARQALDAAFAHLAGGQAPSPARLEVGTRVLEVPCQARHAARFAFDDLCGRPLGGADYLALARAYRTLFIDDISAMDQRRRNEARRFITLIDILYDNRVALLCSAAAPPEALYPAGDGAFRRTASRLLEMRSARYLERCRAAP